MARSRSKWSVTVAVAVAGLVTAVLVPLGSVGAAPQPAQGRSAHGKVTRDRLKLVRKVNVRQLTTSGVAGQTASGSLARGR